MAVTETITKKFYRVCVDKAQNVWERIAFWTTADQVAVEVNGKTTNLQETVGNIRGIDYVTAAKAITEEGYALDARTGSDIYEKINPLFANGKITGMSVGQSLPSDAGSHPTTLFFVTE